MNAVKRFTIILLTVFLLLTGSAEAETDETRIENFDVHITVNEDNTYHVVQNLRVHFSTWGQEHGIIEEIELNPYVYFVENGEYYSRSYRVQVGNVWVSTSFETYTEDGMRYIRIGDADILVSGETKNYEISYDFLAGDDGFPDFDMFYYAIVADGWRLPIDHVNFSVQMPKEFDSEAVGFSVGWEGDAGYNPDTLSYTVDGTTITGSLRQGLEPYEGLNIRISLPADYFDAVSFIEEPMRVVILISAATAAAMAVLLLMRRRRLERYPVTVEVEPPEGLTPADVGYVIDGLVEDRDVVALLIYWADKGYIRIVEIAPDKPGRKVKDMLFVKIQNLPADANDYEHLMFDAIFEKDVRVSTRDLQNTFYKTLQQTKKRIKRKYADGPNRIFVRLGEFFSDLCCALAALPAALLGAIEAYAFTFEAIAAIVCGVFLFILGYILAGVYCRIVKSARSERRKTKRLRIVLLVVFAVLYLGILSLSAASVVGLWAFLPVICSLFLAWIAPKFIRRTELGAMYLAKILGLRRFIERAEKPRLEMLAQQNPEYFYNVLPYAYVLGVSDVWSRQFESLVIPPPSWYAGYDDSVIFTTALFTSNMDRTFQRAQSAMSSSPSSGSGGGGGFSGGGFSGGSFGGGGGGSW